MAHHYVQGDKVVCCVNGGAELDSIVAVTARSVVTERHGTFLLARIAPDGSAARYHPQDPRLTVAMWPAGHAHGDSLLEIQQYIDGRQ
jgi:hypothetical protein